MLFCCFEAFWGKFTVNFPFYSKKWLSLRGVLKHSESLFLLTCLKRVNPEVNLNMFKPYFLIKPVKWGMSHIQQKYVFHFFWRIFWEIYRELLFLVQKWLSQKGALKYSESLFFLTCLKRVNPEENLDMFKQLVLINL